MLRQRWLTVILLFLGLSGLAQGQRTSVADEEQVLRQANIPSDNAGLLRFFQERTAAEPEQEKLAALVHNLGAASYGAREQAAGRLLKAGSLARPVLKLALASADQEVARRAALCLRRLDQGPDAVLATASAHLLAHRKPVGAAQVLLDYLPFAPNTAVAAEVCRALDAVTLRDGRPEPGIITALTDRLPVKRAAAGAALARTRLPEQVAAARGLLLDTDPQVRLQVGLALVEARDKTAVPVLIDLVGVLPEADFWQVEEVLLRLAGAQAPKLTWDDATPPAKVHAAWAGWWKEHGANLDLAKRAQPLTLGYTLITQMSGQGQLRELGADGKVRWQIDGLVYPVDAEIVAEDRVLVAEYLNHRVTERDFKGNVLWKYEIHMPITCQRLPGGNTFIATRRQMLVVERGGKEVFTYSHANTSISAARRLRNGHIVLVDIAGKCKWLDARGNMLKEFQIGMVNTIGSNIDILPGGHILAPHQRQDKVAEYDGEGKVVWEAAVPSPTSAVRLPDGHTLVVSSTRQRVMELDGRGQEVWQHQTEGRPWRARRR